jgi:hypothetical protein
MRADLEGLDRISPRRHSLGRQALPLSNRMDVLSCSDRRFRAIDYEIIRRAQSNLQR